MLLYCSVKPKILISNNVEIAAKKHDLLLMGLNNFNPTK